MAIRTRAPANVLTEMDELHARYGVTSFRFVDDLWEDHFYPEIVDLVTGQVLPDGERGELVFTTLTRRAVPTLALEQSGQAAGFVLTLPVRARLRYPDRRLRRPTAISCRCVRDITPHVLTSLPALAEDRRSGHFLAEEGALGYRKD